VIALRDVVLVAGFEVGRALRTWRALSLVAVSCVGTGGSTWLFIQFIGLLERELAETLQVAATDVPGTMLAELVQSDLWRGVLTGMVGSETRAEALLAIPVLAIFHRWVSFLLVPLFAATASAECLAIDVASRAIRYEATRTGRSSIVFGRWAGQLALSAGASLCGAAVTWGLGRWAMVGNEPFPLIIALLDATGRAWLFALPASAAGVLASALVRSAAWARVLALGAVVGSWVAYGACALALARGAPWQGTIANAIVPLLPQGWLAGLWEPVGWIAPLALAGLGAAVASFAALRFATRDL
jgi:hypothetical protein